MNKLIWALALCLTWTACCSRTNSNQVLPKVEQTSPQEMQDQVEVLYFYGKKRCATCLTIEQQITEVIKNQYANEVQNGKVVFKTIDITKSENEAIAEQYKVTWSSLFINQWKGGRKTSEDLTKFAFANARTTPDKFQAGVVDVIDNMLK